MDQTQNSLQIVKLNYIRVKNFKSFNQTDDQESTIIGPFTQLNSIVGPNGTGKSNIIDAICFLFGVSLSSMRQFSLKGLINNNVCTPNKEAYVILNVDIKYRDANSVNEMSSGQMEFKRSIILNENDRNDNVQTKFFINNQEFDRDSYMFNLEKFNILPDAKNFLLMQGETDSISNLNPEALTKYFEKLSGSYRFENEYNEVQQSYENVLEIIRKSTQKMSQLKQERKKMKQIRNKNEEYQKIIKVLDLIEKKQTLLKILKLDTELEFSSKKLANLVHSTQNTQDEREQKRQKLIQNQDQIQNLQKQLKEISEQYEKLVERKNTSQQNSQKLIQEIKYKQAQLPIYEQSFKEFEKKVEDQLVIQKDLEQQKNKILKEIEDMENQQQEKMRNNMSDQQRKEFDLLQTQSRDQNYRYNQQIKKTNQDLGNLQSEISILQEDLKNNEKNFNEQENLTLKNQETLKNKIAEKKIQNEILQNLKNKSKELENQKQQYEQEVEKIRSLNFLNEQLNNSLEILQNQQIEDLETDKIVYELKSQVNGCLGTFGQNLKLIGNSLQYEKALKQALGRFLNYIIVSDQNGASQCNEILKQKGVSKDLIILDRIPDFNNKKLQLEKLKTEFKSLNITLPLKKVVSNSKDLRVQKCLEYFLNEKIFVSDYSEAVKLQNQDCVREIIGLEDNSVLNVKQGMIKTLGSNTNFSSYKFGSQAQNEKEQQYAQQREEINKQIQKNVNEIEQLKLNTQNMEFNSLATEIFEAQNKITNLENDITKLKNQGKNNGVEEDYQQNIQKLKYQIEKKQTEIHELEQDKNKYLQDQQQIDNTIFKDFCQKYNISNIQDFKEKDLDQIEEIHRQIQLKNHQKNMIENQLQENRYEKYQSEVQKFKNNIEFTQKVIENNEKIISDDEIFLKDFQNQNQILQEKKSDLQNKIDQKNKVTMNLGKDLQNQRQNHFQNNVKIQQLQNEISRIFTSKQNLIDQADLEGIKIQFIEEEIEKINTQQQDSENDENDEQKNNESDDDNDEKKKNSHEENKKIKKQKKLNIIQESQDLYEYFKDLDENVLPSQTLDGQHFEKYKIVFSDIKEQVKQVNQLKKEYKVNKKIQVEKNSTKVNKMEVEDDDDDEVEDNQIQRKNSLINNKYQDDLEKCLDKIQKYIEEQLEIQDENEEKNKDQLEEYHSKTLNEGVLGDNEVYQKLEKKIKDLDEELTNNIDEKNEIKEKFESIKQQRIQMFRKLYDQVEQRINSNYKLLNENKKQKLHCSASLMLENKDEPYRGGIIYTPNPPGKVHVYDIDGQLSGGEKTMATLALFFTVNQVIQTPFLIFDEADAYLDYQNTQNYVRYLKLITRQNEAYFTQCFVISHKKQVYDRSNSFIGVTLNREQSSTQVFSLLNTQ